ncbi:hypothetical protein ACQ4PT_056400 [Festuca glaucescens]
MALSSSRPHHLLRRLHASAQALARVDRTSTRNQAATSGAGGSPPRRRRAAAGGGDTREAWARLERLRKGYARDVGKLRKQYAYEAQLLEAERQRKAEARAEAVRVANEERKAAKAAAAQTRAAERRGLRARLPPGPRNPPSHPRLFPYSHRFIVALYLFDELHRPLSFSTMESASITDLDFSYGSLKRDKWTTYVSRTAHVTQHCFSALACSSPMKERAEKLESWRNKEKLKAQKKTDHRELLRKKSSMWISEDKMETKILQAIMHTTPL